MLLAIDVGNTQTVYGVWDGSQWLKTWRRSTSSNDTEDQLAAWLKTMFDLAGLQFSVDFIVCASVVPPLNRSIVELGLEHFELPVLMVGPEERFGLKIGFSPAASIGADRIANCLGALAKWKPPLVVVDFGTATTFDIVDSSGIYLGGAILPGIEVSTEALVSKAAKLPRIEIKAPERAIGRSTVEALQSGVVIGYSGAIDALNRRIEAELDGKPKVIATGGLGGMFVDLCETIDEYDGLLTLDGLRLAHDSQVAGR